MIIGKRQIFTSGIANDADRVEMTTLCCVPNLE